MKKITFYFSAIVLSTLLFSCGITNVTRFSNNELEVAATSPKVYTVIAGETEIAATKPLEISATTSLPTSEEKITKQVKAVVKFNESAQKLSLKLESLTASTEDVFAKKTLHNASEMLSKFNVNAEKLSFFDKLKIRIFGKLFNRYSEKLNSSMDTADILAIVSLATGCVAIIGYFYATFLFGIAAIVTGVIALKKGTSRRGMALAGIILGAVAIFLWTMLFLLFIGSWAIL